MKDLNGKVAVVTGASSGIGRATALALAQRGANVVVHYFRNKTGAEETAASVRETGREVLVVGANVAKQDEVRAMAAATLAQFGRVDVLINNAGDLIGRRPLLEITEAQWREVLDVNATSTLFACQAFAPGMVERRAGAIVNMTSIAAHNGGGPGAGAYAAAKATVIAFSKALARELAPHGVRVNCVSPGLIDDTNFHARYTTADAFAGIVKGIPLGRAGTPEECATVIAFLASGEAAFLTGETIEINGGALMR